ncbi:MAG: hypothetical protein ABW360_07965 [Phenylobacterium sp.]
MISMFPVRRALTLAAVAMAAILTACAEPPAPEVVVAPPPAVGLSPQVVEYASAYRAYVAKASAISPGFTNGASVAEGVRTGAAYEPEQLLRGAIAYGAVAALQDPAFLAGVRTYAGDATQRRTIAYEIMKDPAYVVGLQGSASAAGLVMTALGEDGEKLFAQGRMVKQAAYDVQRSSWSKADVSGRESRLSQAKQLSATVLVGDVAETNRLQSATVGAAPLGLVPRTASPPYTPVVIRSLAVAALATLGYGDQASIQQVMPMLTDPNSATCLKMSKLNLYQCLAVSKPHYEDVFCLGQHIMMDTGQCVMKAAGVAVPVDPKLAVAAANPVTPVSTTATVKPRPKKR